MKNSLLLKLTLYVSITLFPLCLFGQKSTKKSQDNLKLIKQVLTSSTEKGFNILENKDEFLKSALIDAVVPQKLKEINTNLENLGMKNLVDKEKLFIAEAAEASVNVAKPIVNSAIQQITLKEVISILSAKKGGATEFLKNKTRDQLITAVQPIVENKLNSNGITAAINTLSKEQNVQQALNNFLSKEEDKASLKKENDNFSISKYASEQIVDGLFEVSKDYEVNNSNIKSNLINSIFKK